MEDACLSSTTAWKEFAQAKLPLPCYINQRNQKITCIYATLYNQFPKMFKWAGMASFASHKVGLALRPFQFHQQENAL